MNMRADDTLVIQVLDQLCRSVDIGIDRNSVQLDMHLGDDLGLKSMDAVAIALDMELGFNIHVENEDLVALRTVGDVVDLVRNKLEENAKGTRPAP